MRRRRGRLSQWRDGAALRFLHLPQRAALPAPARAELDAISAALPTLRQTLERVNALDPNAQDARRLMSLHLPGLIDRYRQVPQAFRDERDGEGISVDERLIEGLAAGRAALGEISEKLARADVSAFETQGRFIQSRYGEDGPKADLPAVNQSTLDRNLSQLRPARQGSGPGIRCYLKAGR